jgi:hypothetical protein
MTSAVQLVPISRTTSVTVWCVVSREEADLLPHTMEHLLNEPTVNHVVIVHTGPSLPSCYGELQRAWPKVQELHQDFGEGLDKSVDEGGFNQVDARNFALRIAESLGDPQQRNRVLRYLDRHGEPEGSGWRQLGAYGWSVRAWRMRPTTGRPPLA